MDHAPGRPGDGRSTAPSTLRALRVIRAPPPAILAREPRRRANRRPATPPSIRPRRGPLESAKRPPRGNRPDDPGAGSGLPGELDEAQDGQEQEDQQAEQVDGPEDQAG